MVSLYTRASCPSKLLLFSSEFSLALSKATFPMRFENAATSSSVNCFQLSSGLFGQNVL